MMTRVPMMMMIQGGSYLRWTHHSWLHIDRPCCSKLSLRLGLGLTPMTLISHFLKIYFSQIVMTLFQDEFLIDCDDFVFVFHYLLLFQIPIHTTLVATIIYWTSTTDKLSIPRRHPLVILFALACSPLRAMILFQSFIVCFFNVFPNGLSLRIKSRLNADNGYLWDSTAQQNAFYSPIYHVSQW